MNANIDTVFDDPTLLSSPVMRAAYSDRTAWLMSAMSELAYYPFEDGDVVSSLAKEIAQISNVEDIQKKLETILNGRVAGGNEETLKKVLSLAHFDLIGTYNRGETQAFLAKRLHTSGKGMLVLAFRGTEKNMADFYTDIRADLITMEGEEKVHKGFFTAFNHIKDAIGVDLESHKGLPLYITGHSLGGALAVLATRLLASDSQGACYTFGGPRVGNFQVANQIKTPIYRIVNSADGVPRLPPSWTITVAIAIFNLLHLGVVSKFLRKFKGYVHFGDMRYLTHVEPTTDNNFPGLTLHSNPSLPLRAGWAFRRWVATMGKAAATDHSITLYRRKLKSYALGRQHIGMKVVMPETAPQKDDKV